MDATPTNTSTGARGFGFLLMGEEIMYMLGEARYALLLLVLLIIADFRYGRRESSVRCDEAHHQGDTYLEAKYQWRTSRAVRRSINKLLDYVLFAVLGLILGVQLLEPTGIDRIWGTYGAMTLVAYCELKSIFGHFLFLHGRGMSPSHLTAFVERFVVILAKKKNEDVGNALDEAIHNGNTKDITTTA